MLSLRRPGCSLLLIREFPRFPGGVRVGLEAADWEWTPGGSFTVSGMMGLRRCSRCLKEALEHSEVEEAQLNTEEVELAGVRFGAETRPVKAFGRWARSDGLGGQTGLYLFSWAPPRPALLQSRRHRPSPSLVQTFRLRAVNGGALLLVQETLGAQRGLGVQVLLV